MLPEGCNPPKTAPGRAVRKVKGVCYRNCPVCEFRARIASLPGAVPFFSILKRMSYVQSSRLGGKDFAKRSLSISQHHTLADRIAGTPRAP